jgi:hypothetical protein
MGGFVGFATISYCSMTSTLRVHVEVDIVLAESAPVLVQGIVDGFVVAPEHSVRFAIPSAGLVFFKDLTQLTPPPPITFWQPLVLAAGEHRLELEYRLGYEGVPGVPGIPGPGGVAEAMYGFEVRVVPEPPTAVDIDIKPGSCPNSWNRESNGVLPVAILGTEDFDVTEIDLSSVTISRADGTGGSVGPNEGPPGPHSVFEDVGTPFEGEVCDCHEAEGDGFLDLSLKLRTQDVADLLPVDDPNGALVPLIVEGTLLDGTPFEGSDCVRLVPPGSPPNQVTVQSIAGAWVDATPLDNNLDGGGFGGFQRTYPHTTVLTLTGPSGHDGNPFVGWRLDGGDLVQERSITLVVNNAEHVAKAVFKKASGCGLGVELVLLLPALIWLQGRRKQRMQ